jgi:hypothetical protein
MVMAKILKSMWMVAMLVVMFGCSNDKTEEEFDEPKATRTVLVYIAANNDLSSFASMNISDMVKGAAAANLSVDNLIVYVSGQGDVPHLYRITNQGKQLIKSYPQQNSLDKEVMAGVLSEVREMYPAPSNGVISWSHGYGWMPRSVFGTRAVSETNSPHPMTKNFGVDNLSSSGISAEDIASLLPDNVYDFIAFDACYMGAIEVVWALRKKCDYMMLSAAEVLSEGLPYKMIVSELFATGQADLKTIAKKYFDVYNSSASAYERSATIAVVDCKYVDEMAAELKDIIIKFGGNSVDVSKVQWFDRTVYGRHFAYDIGDYVDHMVDSSGSALFYEKLNKAIVAKYTTPTLWVGDYRGRDITVRKFNGLSIFIPTADEADNVMNVYKKTDWYKYLYSE